MLDQMNTLKEQLLSLPDDMLLNIDPRDNRSLESGVNFIKSFNDNYAQFADGIQKIEIQIKQHFSIDPEQEEVVHDTTSGANQVNRLIKELDKTESHSIDESFTFKRPFGFVLGNTAYKGIKTWKNLYIQVLKELKAMDPVRFANLPSESKFISRRGNPLFATSEEGLRSAEKLHNRFYIETNLSANSITTAISDLLVFFDIKPSSIKIYLREDRDAQ